MFITKSLLVEVQDWPRLREARNKDRNRLLARVVTKISSRQAEVIGILPTVMIHISFLFYAHFESDPRSHLWDVFLV